MTYTDCRLQSVRFEGRPQLIPPAPLLNNIGEELQEHMKLKGGSASHSQRKQQTTFQGGLG